MDVENLTMLLAQLIVQQQTENRKQQDFMIQFMEKFSSSNCSEHTDASELQTEAI